MNATLILYPEDGGRRFLINIGTYPHRRLFHF